jgi:hypothetical protein
MSEGDDRVPQPGDDGPAYLQPPAIERRVWRNCKVVVALAVLISAPLADLKITLGLGLGGALALLNYRWLQSSVRDILKIAGPKVPPGTYLKFVVRWLVVGAIAWAANETGYFEGTAILAGLFAPALAIMVEAGYTTLKSLTGQDGNQ